MAERLDLGGMIWSLAAFDVSSLAVDEVRDVVLDAQALANAAATFSAAVLEHFHRSGVWADDGSLSAAAWAASRTGAAIAATRAQVGIGRVQRTLPSVAAPARQGRLTADHLRAMARCQRQHPDLAARDEELLVGQALGLDADAFRAAARHWCSRAADVAAADPEPGPEPASEVHLSQTFDGWWALNGLLSP